MSKKKDSPALYELIHKGKGGFQITVPPWMTGGKKPQETPQAEAPPQAAAPPSAPEPSPFEVPARPPEKIVATEGKWLKLALTPAHLVVAGVVLVVLIAIVFVLGRVARSSSKQAPPAAKTPIAPTKQTAQPKPLPAAVAEPKEAPAAAKPLADSTAELKKGKYYLVVQGLRGMENSHRADAEAIANFLNNNGEPVTVMTYKGTPQQYIVLSKRGFDSPDSPEAKKYLQAIEEQGKLYKSQGGKYDFNQGASGWFVKM